MEAKSSTLNSLYLPTCSNEDQALLLECPSCQEKLSPYNMAQHCEEEMTRLKQMEIKVNTDVESKVMTNSQVTNEDERRKPWTVFKRVQRNRQSRLKRSRKYVNSEPLAQPSREFPCPICNERFTELEVQSHTERCLRQSNGTTNGLDDNSSNDDDDGEEYEEYEWAGQKRIRVSSLLQGGYAAIGVGQTITNSNNGNIQDEDEEDLNVDEDDSQIYGPPQYRESDIIVGPNNNDGSDVTNYMRRLITGETTTNNDEDSNQPADEQQEVITDNTDSCDIKENNIPKNEANPPETQNEIIEALKAKLRNYENQVQNKYKCLICLDDYRNPAISVSCWHVHCEQCWLRSLGSRKLCPQCNLITTPKDLRRIYM